MYSDALNPFGLLDGQLVSVNDVPSGIACGCLCPKCKQPLVARKGTEKIHHFSHRKKTKCTGGLETALHIKSKEIFRKYDHIFLPPYPGQYWRSISAPPVNRLFYEDVLIETRIGSIRPDIILTGECTPFIVEIYVSNRMNDEKINTIKKMFLPCVEIDLRYLRRLDLLDEGLIENALITCTHTKYWISHLWAEGLEEDVYSSWAWQAKCS